MVSRGVGVLTNGISQLVPIGPEGVPIVTSEVVDPGPVGNSWDFRMLGQEHPPHLIPLGSDVGVG